MTGFDIFSAVGSVGEDLLEEAETERAALAGRFVPAFNRARRFGTSHMPMLAAAACFALFALGLRYIYHDSGIEQPVRNNGLNSITTYSAPNFTDLISDTTETQPEILTELTEISAESVPAETAFADTQTEISEIAATGTVAETTSTADTEKITRESARTETVTAEDDEIQEPFVTGTEAPDYDESLYFPYFPWDMSAYESGTAFTAKPPATESVTVGGTDTDDGEDESVDNDDGDYDSAEEITEFIFLDFGGNRYALTGESFERNELTPLGSGELYSLLPDGGRVGKPCEIYRINDLSENYMLAVSAGGNSYVGFGNQGYKPNSLSEYAADINFLNRNYFSKVRAENADGSGYTEYALPDLRQAAERLILSVPDAAEADIPAQRGVERYIILDSEYRPNAVVYENGYISISGRTFRIGSEYAAAFISYIEANCVGSEFFPYNGNEDVFDDLMI